MPRHLAEDKHAVGVGRVEVVHRLSEVEPEVPGEGTKGREAASSPAQRGRIEEGVRFLATIISLHVQISPEAPVSGAPRKEIPPPKGDDDFEDLALALFRAVWKDPGAKLHGRSGQGQDGVDVYGEDSFGGTGLNGVQCKHH